MAKRGENIYKRKDGRWEGRYIKGRKKNGSIQFGYIYSRSYQDLRKKLYEKKLIYADQNFGTHNQLTNITIEKWLISWLLKQKNTVKYNTYRSYKSNIEHHILPFFADYSLSSVTKEDIQRWLSSLEATLKPSSIRIAVRIFSMSLNDAVIEERITKNPTKGIRLPEEPANQVKAFSSEEQRRLEEQIFLNDKSFKNFFPIYLTLYTGMRISELTGLKWEDVHWQDKYLSINQGVQRIKESDQKTYLKETTLKTKNSQRTIPLSDSMIYLLHQWQDQCLQNSKYVVSGRNGLPMDPRNLRYHFKRLKELSDVQDLPFHSLRHSFATRCIESNASITTLSALMGHKSTKMTLDIYTSSFFSEKQKVIDSLIYINTDQNETCMQIN